jgi:(p)ppGpp synthase/HD superfamily hydrolase
MEQILKQIIAFVDQAHGDQTRKYTPDRYVVHPVRVMRICQKYTDDLPVLF